MTPKQITKTLERTSQLGVKLGFSACQLIDQAIDKGLDISCPACFNEMEILTYHEPLSVYLTECLACHLKQELPLEDIRKFIKTIKK